MKKKVANLSGKVTKSQKLVKTVTKSDKVVKRKTLTK